MLNNLLAMIKCILDFMLFFWFSTLFFDRRWEGRKAFSFALLITFAVLLNAVNLLHIPVLNTVVTLSLVLAMNLFLYTGPVRARIICTAAEVLLIVICEFIPVGVYSMVHNTSITSAGRETIKNAGLNLASTCLFSIVILSIRHIITRRRQKEEKDMVITENISIIAVPLVSILTLYYLFSFDGSSPASSLQSLILFLGILCMNIAVILGDNSSREHYRLQRELDRLYRLEQLNQVVIQQQDQYIQEMKGFAHDYTKQLEGMKELISHGERAPSGQLRNYADEMLRNIEESCRFAFIPSPALRAILTQAQLRCNSSHVELEADIGYADFSFIAFPDLYTLFENPLDNALTACREMTGRGVPRYIRLRILKEKDLIWVEIKNPKSNSIIVKDNSIQTTKKDPARHGLGLKNMERVIRRYEGYINIDYDSNEFTVTMAFPAPKA